MPPRVQSDQPTPGERSDRWLSGWLEAHAFALTLAICAVFFAPELLGDRVIFTRDNRVQVGLERRADPYPSNPLFGDHSDAYIPEIAQHLSDSHHSWLATWTPQVELGRPLWHWFGFSKAWLPAHGLALLGGGPFEFYDRLAALTITLTACFLFLLLRVLELRPVACLAGALSLALGPYMLFWSTFVMFLGSACWTACLLWLIAEATSGRAEPAGPRSVLRWSALFLGVSFASYSMLLAAYPQEVVQSAYLLVAFTLWRLVSIGSSVGEVARRAALLGAAAVSGLLAASPVLLDLLTAARRSASLQRDEAFFLANLPDLSSLGAVVGFASRFIDAFVFGNPILPDYPFPHDGSGVAPLHFGLLAVALVCCRLSKTWFWFGCSVLFATATVSTEVYRFAIANLGFHLSRASLIAGSILPICILAGYAVDDLLGSKRKSQRWAISVAAALWLVLVLHDGTEKVQWPAFLFSVASWAGLMALTLHRRPALILLLILASSFFYGRQLLPSRPTDSIALESPFLRAVESVVKDGRFARFGRPFPVLHQGALFGLPTIHSYDSLSPRQFHRFAQELNRRGASQHGRIFLSIDPLGVRNEALLDLANVRGVISRRPLRGLEVAHAGRGLFVLERKGRMAALHQLDRFTREGGEVRVPPSPANWSTRVASESIRLDDYLAIEVSAAEHETLLFLSQQHHPHWVASGSGQELETVRVNGLFQGVVVPPGTERIELRFRPFVWWSWVPQLAYLLGGAAVLVFWRHVRRRAVGS